MRLSKSIKSLPADALYINATPLFNGLSEKLAALSLQHQIPAIYQFSPVCCGLAAC